MKTLCGLKISCGAENSHWREVWNGDRRKGAHRIVNCLWCKSWDKKLRTTAQQTSEVKNED